MKLLIILTIVFILLLLVYLRLRPYIRMARRMFGIVRDVRGMGQNEMTQPLRSEAVADNKLLRCAACGTWTPATRAVKLRSTNATYCSHTCLETSATGNSKRKTAS